MDNLLKQIRVRFSGLEEDSEPNVTREKRIPPQKTQSFKTGKAKVKNWFQRQLSGRSSDSDTSDDGEFETVIAASAFAITSVEDDSITQKRSPETSLTKMKSRKEENLAGTSDSGKISRSLTREPSVKKPEVTQKKTPENAATSQKMPENATGKVPSIKRTSTLSETQPSDKSIVKSETVKGTMPKRSVSFNHKPTAPTNNYRTQEGSSADKNRIADAWEKEKMAQIAKRYERQKSEILTWENEKQTQARRRMEKKERALELKRARATQEFRNQMARINKIAGGARAIAEDRKKNDELKIKEKAKIIRSTGKTPVTCYCF